VAVEKHSSKEKEILLFGLLHTLCSLYVSSTCIFMIFFAWGPVQSREDFTLKGQCHQIFHLWFFFFKQLLLAPVDKPNNNFDFFRIFAKIFDFSGASPVSLTPAKQTVILLLDDSFELLMDAIEK
jgi:hypothetical protein